ncbi:MAG: glycosyltransferase [Desulfovibrio sp.]|nr:glycosyltransferase [Desulfovibrio sp.]
MKFSLVVVTTDRLSLVERLFRSLEAQTHKDFEVFFVHGSDCSEEAFTVADRFPSLAIRILASPDHCLSRSRNLALPQVTGDVIAFPDDDCVYTPETLRHCAEAFTRQPPPDVILGGTAGLGENIPVAHDGLNPLTSRYALFKYSISYTQFHKRDVVQAVGGFDENLGLGSDGPYQSGEDTDYVLRARESGFRICRARSVIVRHPSPDLGDPALKGKVRAYAKGRMYLLRKHRLPRWFVLSNIIWPLLCLPVECLRACLPVIRYRWGMFSARLLAG